MCIGREHLTRKLAGNLSSRAVSWAGAPFWVFWMRRCRVSSQLILLKMHPFCAKDVRGYRPFVILILRNRSKEGREIARIGEPRQGRYSIRWRSIRAVLLLVPLSACGGQAELIWQVGDNLRWAELSVPSRGRDGFQQMSPDKTDITFANDVTEEQALLNEHLFNGSGVALGDVDGDGLVDIYFASLDGPNVLYRNLGGWRFEDITDQAGVGAPGRFSTGAVLADVDGDEDLDLLVTAMEGPNAFFLNDGTGVFQERTAEYGLASDYYGTTQTLADVDGDGDLDLYVANNKVKPVRDIYPPNVIAFDQVVEEVNGEFTVKPEFRDHYQLVQQLGRLMRFEYAEPDKFYLNDGTGHFEEVPFTSGWVLDEDGEPLTETPRDWGLTARFQDADRDGDPDLYVCNDFESPDRFWIYDGTGRFQLIDRVALRATSNATMTMDMGDLDRDGDEDFILIDMLDLDTRQQKTQVQAMVPEPTVLGDIYNRPQIGRNTLSINRGDMTFAEIGHFAGIEASGWSWSVLFFDVDLDGLEDILIGTGHRYDFLDSDTQERVQTQRDTTDWRRWRFLFPNLHLPNAAFRNNGDLTFDEVAAEWGLADERDVAQGAATGDLDLDGDLDIVFNRLGMPASVYQNMSSRARVAVRLKGESPNTRGVGARVTLFGGAVPSQHKEVLAGGFYTSSPDPQLMFAAGEADTLSLMVEWRSGRRSVVEGVVPNRIYEVDETGAVEPADGETPFAEANGREELAPYFVDESARLGHTHVEDHYDDFARQKLLRHKLSQLGPGISWIDFDRDGDEDLFIGSGQDGRIGFYRNDGGRFVRVSLGMASADFDLTTILPRYAGSNTTSLLVGQMNYEAINPTAASSAASVLRVDIPSSARSARSVNPRVSGAVPGAESSTGPMALADYDGDGDLDLFDGGRTLPAQYPLAATSRLFKFQAGTFEPDAENSETFAEIGMVSAVTFSDVDGDGDSDLVLAIDWGALRLFENENGRFSDVTEPYGLAGYLSMWNGITTGDFNGDGLQDLVATNWGRNTRLETTADHPLVMFYGDFEGNGMMDILEARYEPRLGDLAPIRGRQPVTDAMPFIARRIQSYSQYADATVHDVVGPALGNAPTITVNTFDHMLFLNTGGRFEARPLPNEAQYSPSFYAGVADFNGDGLEDLFLSQNFYPVEPEMPRYAAGRGLWLEGDGAGNLSPISGMRSGIKVYGDQRGAALADFNRDGRVDLAVSQNGNQTKLFRNVIAEPGLRVRLIGPVGNPDALGATIRLVYGERMGPAREVHGGSGYWSFDGPVKVLGKSEEPTAVWVRWPGGEETTTPVSEGVGEITIRRQR